MTEYLKTILKYAWLIADRKYWLALLFTAKGVNVLIAYVLSFQGHFDSTFHSQLLLKIKMIITFSKFSQNPGGISGGT